MASRHPKTDLYLAEREKGLAYTEIGKMISMSNKQLAKLIFHAAALVVCCTLLAAALVTWFGL